MGAPHIFLPCIGLIAGLMAGRLLPHMLHSSRFVGAAVNQLSLSIQCVRFATWIVRMGALGVNLPWARRCEVML
jgi:hypothetical protein